VSDFTQFHDDLREAAHDLLAPTSPLATGGDVVAPDWSRLVQAGWPGLEVPERLGGAGASFAELAVVLEEVGRAATVAPLLGSVLSVAALRLAEPSPAWDELQEGIAAGEVRVAVALPTGDRDPGAPPFRIERASVGRRLVGAARFVPDAPGADRLLVLADDPASGPVLVDATPGTEVEVRATPVVDATRSLGEVVAGGVPIEPDRVIPLRGDAGDLRRRGALAVALDSVGLAGAALDATVAYVGVRRQFGRPVGSFQAVKHACADVAVALTLSRRLVADAVEQVVAGAPDATVAVAMAKAHAVETATAATGTAVQLHGGIGYTWEHGLHVLQKRAALNLSLFGSPAAHRAVLAQRYSAAVRV
jgi:alkylation response protein AidB-like acyl-CoA dehydrogenase